MPTAKSIPADQLIATWTDRSLTRTQQAQRLGISRSYLSELAGLYALPALAETHGMSLDDRIRHLWSKPDLSRAQQARALRMSLQSLRAYAVKHDLPGRERGEWVESCKVRKASDAQVRAIWSQAHLTRDEQARAVGLTRSTLRLRASGLGLPLSRIRWVMPTDDQVREMWSRSDLTRLQQATALGISRPTMRALALRLGLIQDEETRPAPPTPRRRAPRQRGRNLGTPPTPSRVVEASPPGDQEALLAWAMSAVAKAENRALRQAGTLIGWRASFRTIIRPSQPSASVPLPRVRVGSSLLEGAL